MYRPIWIRHCGHPGFPRATNSLRALMLLLLLFLRVLCVYAHAKGVDAHHSASANSHRSPCPNGLIQCPQGSGGREEQNQPPTSGVSTVLDVHRPSSKTHDSPKPSTSYILKRRPQTRDHPQGQYAVCPLSKTTMPLGFTSSGGCFAWRSQCGTWPRASQCRSFDIDENEDDDRHTDMVGKRPTDHSNATHNRNAKHEVHSIQHTRHMRVKQC